MKKTGDIIRFRGKEYTLGQPLGGGGEGTVFEISIPTRTGEIAKAAVKIIDTKKKTSAEIALIRRQINDLIDARNRSKEKAKTSHSVSLADFMVLPQAILEDDVGYVMSLVQDSEPLTNYLTIPKDPMEQEEWQRKYDLHRRYRVIAYLFERLEKIHIDGLIFSDLSPNNILVSQKTHSSLKFIDTDNLRTKSNPFTNVLGTPGFIAPELYRKPSRPDVLTEEEAQNVDGVHLLSEESDIYSAAIIAFELLTFNHPFKGIKAVGEDTTPEDELAAEMGQMDYILKPGTDNYCEGNIFIDKFDSLTTPEIRDLFARTFVEGKTNPLRRPTASEFKNEFQRASRLIVKCPHCGEESIYSTRLDAKGRLISDTLCINPDCGQSIDGQLLFTIYACGSGKSAEEVILGPAAVNHQAIPTVLSRIILREREEQNIYFPDIGISGDLKKDDRFCRLLVSGPKAAIEIFQQPEGSTIQIVSRQGKAPVPVANKAEFPYENDYILFHNIKTRHGTITIKGEIQKV